ncbi:MAG: DUF2285 domain-containing protein [Mesorhizobium sp.]|nr:MAG: DUF2285 domain-containing protein [Mesorhizobium sp.]
MRDFKTAGAGFPQADNIVWTEQASPRVLRATRMSAAISPSHQRIRPSRLIGASVWQQEEELHILWSASSGKSHLVCEDRSGEFGAIFLPLDAAFETRLDAARRLWRALNGRAFSPSYGSLPPQTKIRHILNLRAHDGRHMGATYRQIAEVLLSREPIVPRDWRDHHLRHKVRAILRRAAFLVAGGYRDLLLYPHSRSGKSSRRSPSSG